MATVYVKPRTGGRVRMPERDFRPMPEEGAHVPRVDYYERLIITGDVIITDPPPPSPQPDEPAAAKPTRSSKEK